MSMWSWTTQLIDCRLNLFSPAGDPPPADQSMYLACRNPAFADKRVGWQLESYRSIEQARADAALFAAYRRRVAENVRRRLMAKIETFCADVGPLLRRQAE
jgi:hypothetical protein